MANENLTNQIVVALLRDGGVLIDSDTLATKVQAAVADIAPGYIFKGVVKPGDAPGRIGGPSIYAACTGGTYYNFGGISVDQFSIILFVSADGASWTSTEVYNAIAEAIANAGGGGNGGDATIIESTGSWDNINQFGQLYATKADAVAAAGITEAQFDALLAGTLFAPMKITRIGGEEVILAEASHHAGIDILEAMYASGYEVRKAVWKEPNDGWTIGIESIFYNEEGEDPDSMNGYYLFGTYYQDEQ